MKPNRLQLHVLFAALVPAMLIAVVLGTTFTYRQLEALDQALLARGQAEANQLASNAQFGLFIGNRDMLGRLVRSTIQGDSAITAVAVVDASGTVLAREGLSVLPQWPLPPAESRSYVSGKAQVVLVPIRREVLVVEDVYSGPGKSEETPRVEGTVILELSRAPMQREQFQLLGIGIVITFAGLLFGGLLAARLARGVTRPIHAMEEAVRRIAAGDLTARVAPDPAATVSQLERGINEMAERIALAQEHLREQVEIATAEMRLSRDDAEAAAAARSRFLAAASHDLRQPMHALGLFVSRLGHMPLGHEAHGVVRYIESSVGALQDLLDTLLDISRIDSGMVSPVMTSIPVDTLFDRLEIELAESIRRKGLQFRRRGGAGLMLRTDAALLERILMNLLSNAGRYTQRGGVLLACRRRGAFARIEVWDSGTGIPAESQRTIFHEYVQLANPERDRAKGLGLGLSICERLARLLDAPLQLRSRPGRGSVFWLDIPLAEAASSPVHAPSTMTDAIGGMAGTVIIIDDDPLVLTGTAELVASWGCRTIIGPTVADAMANCSEAQCRPDVAICDYRLRGFESGINSAQALRLHYGDIPVLMVTGDMTDELRAEAARHRLMLLGKPVRPARLRALLQSLLPTAD